MLSTTGAAPPAGPQATKAETLPLGQRLMAFASGQLQFAQEQLAREGEARHIGVHEARKCIRRTRAALALGVSAVDPRARSLYDELGRLCRGLSRLRDAQALIEVLRRLENSESPEVRAVLLQAEAAARKRREQVLEGALQRDRQLRSRLQRLQAAQRRLLRLEWQAVGFADVEKAVLRSMRRADKARRRLSRHRDDDHAWHVFRRRLRRLRQQDSILAELQPDLRPPINDLEHKASALGESQDDSLLLRHCGRHSPFSPPQRRILRNIARERLQRTRCTSEDFAALTPRDPGDGQN
ncbi:MAG: CHAD domain-containing protein [Rhodanobacteraceae bacterium]|nr:CHAD domain-containing protein [Rhodanobacteraceae bacterium]